MANTCSIEGCEREAGNGNRKLRGWCFAHYQVWVKYRDPEARPVRQVNTGACRVCGKPSENKRLNWCEACYYRTRRNGHSGYTNTRIAEPSYRAAHSRVARDRGKAKEHACADCGGQGAHWSFAWKRVASIEWLWENFGGTHLAYTGNPADYDPRCASCARRYDSDFARSGWLQPA